MAAAPDIVNSDELGEQIFMFFVCLFVIFSCSRCALRLAVIPTRKPSKATSGWKSIVLAIYMDLTCGFLGVSVGPPSISHFPIPTFSLILTFWACIYPFHAWWYFERLLFSNLPSPYVQLTFVALSLFHLEFPTGCYLHHFPPPSSICRLNFGLLVFSSMLFFSHMRDEFFLAPVVAFPFHQRQFTHSWGLLSICELKPFWFWAS